MCLLDKAVIGPFRLEGTQPRNGYKVLLRCRHDDGAVTYLSPIKEHEHMELGKEYKAEAYDHSDDPVNHGFHAFLSKEGAKIFLKTLKKSEYYKFQNKNLLCVCMVVIDGIFTSGYTQVSDAGLCFQAAATFVSKKMTIVREVK